MKRCPKCGKNYADEANFCPTDAGRLISIADAGSAAAEVHAAPAATDLVGGRFQLGPVLGGDATGEVRRAVDTQTGQAVAVKLVAPEVLAIPQVAQRIDRELKQLERVQHKNVARVLASGKHGDREFVVTELLEGGRPLADLIAGTGPIDPQRASDLVVAIGEALIEAAKVGVVHRDLAPKNVLVTQEALQLINFAVPTPGGKVAGIPEYVAPEAIEGKPVDQRGNIYSLGAIYYFLLTGRAPHVGDPDAVVAAHLAGGVEAPSRHAAVPADVDALVLRALERNAAKRFLTLRQFLDEVERVTQGPAGGVGQTAPFGRTTKKAELSSTLMGFGAADKAALAAKTKAMAVQVPPEARRDDTPKPARPAGPPATVTAPLHAVQPPAADPFAPAAAAMQQAAPAMGAAAESPWGRPGQPGLDAQYGAAAAAMQQAAPAMGAAAAAAAQAAPPAPQVPHAPMVAAPKPAAAASGKKKPEEQKGSKGKFRETMWFKKGEMDAKAAEEAAATGDAAATDKADLLPIEERYGDDGTITRTDAEKYSLKTGATSMMSAVRDDAGPAASGVSERELVGEMKGGRNLVFIILVVAALAIAGIVAAFVL